MRIQALELDTKDRRPFSQKDAGFFS